MLSAVECTLPQKSIADSRVDSGDSDDGFTDDQPLWLYSAHGIDRKDMYIFIFDEIFH